MANNVVLKAINLTIEWVALWDEPLIVDVTLMLRSTTALAVTSANMMLRSGSDTVHWLREIPVQLKGVDLSKLEVSSAYQDMQLLIIGITR